jgi:hypothetical protein
LIQPAITWFDRLIGRLLLTDVQHRITDEVIEEDAERGFKFSLIFSGVRCILQYAVLPVIGIAEKTATPLLLAITLLANISIILSLRRFWQIGYKYRWQYLLMSLVVLAALTAFILLDLDALL